MDSGAELAVGSLSNLANIFRSLDVDMDERRNGVPPHNRLDLELVECFIS